jgi:IS1 family transposase
MNKLKEEQQIAILTALVEGNSIRSIERMTGTHRDTIMRLMVKTGILCQNFINKTAKDLDCARLELDEIWTFCKKKQNRLERQEKHDLSIGDQFVFYAIDPVSKFIPTWVIGKRNIINAIIFTNQLKNTLNGNRPQISSDAFKAYIDAIDIAFGCNVDYAMITKEYDLEHVGPGRYAPPKVSGCVKTVIMGNPNQEHICTSYVERANLTMRTFMRRFTRLALGFSKKLENLKASVALFFTYYNFCWITRTLRITPAMAIGLVSSPWIIKDLFEKITN